MLGRTAVYILVFGENGLPHTMLNKSCELVRVVGGGWAAVVVVVGGGVCACGGGGRVNIKAFGLS